MTAHLVLPPDSRLSESDLQAAAGGRRSKSRWLQMMDGLEELIRSW